MTVFRIELKLCDASQRSSLSAALREQLCEAGFSAREVESSRLFFLEGGLSRDDAADIAGSLLADPVTEAFELWQQGEPIRPSPDAVAFEVHPKPGVMDPVAESTLAELRDEGREVTRVRTARRYALRGAVDVATLPKAVFATLANECIEDVLVGAAPVAPAPPPPEFEFRLRRIPLRTLSDAELERLSRAGRLFLSLEEMRAIQAHFRALEREPTDLELETLAQTWSEHCVHKTLKSAVVYRGAPLPHVGAAIERDLPTNRSENGSASSRAAVEVELRFDNLLRDTIARATRELSAAGRGPQCLSVFEDNAGVIAFDDQQGVAFKVETHNHPSAIEPYGGAATGVGGCIRDIMGCGLGARPIANSDVFCVAPADWPRDGLPAGVLHPWRVLRGMVRGVADYGNRMGIPTVNGAVSFDPRYLGNPLVFCGCVGLIPRDRLRKGARPGDLIVLIGGRTGRDGIHGATFSSAELTGAHAHEFSHAVQIGNAITEKRCLDALLRVRDDAGGPNSGAIDGGGGRCLYSAVTDCGAGGLSSAVGEMGAQVGALVDLETVPLKYAGLRYDEIWISEAQERMVLAVPPENLDRLRQIMREEEVECAVIGRFGETEPRAQASALSEPQAQASALSEPRAQASALSAPQTHADSAARPSLRVRYNGEPVGALDMRFLHEGLPRSERVAHWPPPRDLRGEPAVRSPDLDPTGDSIAAELLRRLASPNIASKEWIIRRYDHEVQGGSVIKPLSGPGAGPNDAAVLRPRLGCDRGVAIGCGLAPQGAADDPYWMALAAIDEAVRNVVAVGGDPRRTALLDNFCWGGCDDPPRMGALVRACQACYDGAIAYGAPFISGKDSLNNELALSPVDSARLLETLREHAGRAGWLDEGEAERLAREIEQTGRLRIPDTLLISAISLVDDVRRCVTADLKRPQAPLLLVGGAPLGAFDPAACARTHGAVADAIQRGFVSACHDVSDGGWLLALAEMCIGGQRGARVALDAAPFAPFAELAGAYVIEAAAADELRRLLDAAGARQVEMARVAEDAALTVGGRSLAVAQLRTAWSQAPG